MSQTRDRGRIRTTTSQFTRRMLLSAAGSLLRSSCPPIVAMGRWTSHSHRSGLLSHPGTKYGCWVPVCRWSMLATTTVTGNLSLCFQLTSTTTVYTGCSTITSGEVQCSSSTITEAKIGRDRETSEKRLGHGYGESKGIGQLIREDLGSHSSNSAPPRELVRCGGRRMSPQCALRFSKSDPVFSLWRLPLVLSKARPLRCVR